MKKHLIRTTVIILVFLTVVYIPAMSVFAETYGYSGNDFKLTIIHLNDTHGRTEAEPYISQMAKDLKANGENVLILDAGDRLHGQTSTNLSKGESMVRIMNAVGYDAMVPGNHDFNFGLPRLLELSNIMDFELLAANVYYDDGYEDKVDVFFAYKIFEMDGVKAGVFGIATPETPLKSDPRITEGLSFGEPARVAESMVNLLKSMDCDIIIALTHVGEDGSSKPENQVDALAAVDGIDVIIDGHSHTLLENGRTVNNTLIAQVGARGEFIGVVEIIISETGVSKTASVLSVPIEGEESSLVPDEEILAIIAEEEDEIEEVTSVVVGTTPFLLQGEREFVRTGETNLANLITDSMTYATGAEIAFLTGGNIRASIEAGDITMGQVLTTLPFSNLLVTVELSGGAILEALEHGVSEYPEPAGSHIQVAGLYFEFEPGAEAGQKVGEVKLAGGELLDVTRIYTVATTEFIAAGGDGYDMVARGSNLIYYGGDAESFAEYLAANPAISAEPEGRVSVSANTTESIIENDNPATRDNSGLRVYILILAGTVITVAGLSCQRRRLSQD